MEVPISDWNAFLNLLLPEVNKHRLSRGMCIVHASEAMLDSVHAINALFALYLQTEF